MIDPHALDWLIRIDLDLAAWLYVAIVGLYLPIASARGRARLAALMKDAPGRTFRKNAAQVQLAILVFGVVVAWTHGVRTLPRPRATWQWLLVLPALGIGETLRWMAWRSMTIDQRRALWVRTILPSRAELPEWTALTLLAAFTEEITYRGLLFGILSAATGSMGLASILSAVSFGAAHAPQGVRSQVVIGLLALVLQALVIATGSLLPAMVVHAAANINSGIRGPKKFRDLDLAAS